MNTSQIDQLDLINRLLAEAQADGNPITGAKAMKLAKKIMRGKTPAEITNRPGTSRTIEYADSTGETAVRNVLDEQRNGKVAA